MVKTNCKDTTHFGCRTQNDQVEIYLKIPSLVGTSHSTGRRCAGQGARKRQLWSWHPTVRICPVRGVHGRNNGKGLWRSPTAFALDLSLPQERFQALCCKPAQKPRRSGVTGRSLLLANYLPNIYAYIHRLVVSSTLAGDPSSCDGQHLVQGLLTGQSAENKIINRHYSAPKGTSL